MSLVTVGEQRDFMREASDSEDDDGADVRSGSWKASGRCSVSPRVASTARSTTVSNSRTLPGQEYGWKACITAVGIVRIVLPSLRSTWVRWCSTRSGISSGRSRSGGIVMLYVFKR